MKKYKIFVVVLVILIVSALSVIGVYILKNDEIKEILNLSTKNTTNNANEQINKEDLEENKEETDDIKDEKQNIKTVGTGIKRPENYTLRLGYCIEDYNNDLSNVINSLKNTTLKNEINKFIEESNKILQEEKENFTKYIEEGNKIRGKLIYEDSYEHKEYNYYDYSFDYGYIRRRK